VHRFSVLADFGLLLLLAVALEALREWIGDRLARLATLAVLVVALCSRGMPFLHSPMHEVAALTPDSRAAYDAVAAAWPREGGGALLELPIRGLLPGSEVTPQTLEPDAMLASTLHWWPTPAGHLSYHPPLRAFFMRTVGALPDPHALADLIDATHVRWLLLRPGPSWPAGEGERERMRAGLLASAAGTSREVAPGWTLLRLDRAPQHPAWFAAARGGQRAGFSPLGSALEPIPEEAARATVRIEAGLGSTARPGPLPVSVAVRNDGDRAWAVVPTPATPLTLDGRLPNLVRRDGTVMLRERWWRIRDGAPADAPLAERYLALRRDLDPGEATRPVVDLRVPAEPGEFLLEIGVEQRGGARFTGAGNAFERRRVTVLEAGDGAAPATEASAPPP